MRREKKICEEPGKGNNISSSFSLADWQNTSLYPGEYIVLTMIIFPDSKIYN